MTRLRTIARLETLTQPRRGDALGDREAALVEGAADDRALEVGAAPRARAPRGRRACRRRRRRSPGRWSRRRSAPARRAPAPPSSRRPRSRCRGSGRRRARRARRRPRRRHGRSPRSSPPARPCRRGRRPRRRRARRVAPAPAARNSGSRSAAVPITTRAAPAASTPSSAAVVAQAAADLDRALDRGGDPPHRLEVARLPRPGAVEVDDVQVLGALPGPAQRRVDRVGVVGRLALVVALHQPHRGAAADVDRRVEDHAAAGALAQTPAKLESSRSPAALDFSGWNWTPKTLSRSAAQAKRSP